jgi:hypothetical protein
MLGPTGPELAEMFSDRERRLGTDDLAVTAGRSC